MIYLTHPKNKPYDVALVTYRRYPMGFCPPCEPGLFGVPIGEGLEELKRILDEHHKPR